MPTDRNLVVSPPAAVEMGKLVGRLVAWIYYEDEKLRETMDTTMICGLILSFFVIEKSLAGTLIDCFALIGN